MSGGHDLNALLRGMDPVLDPETYVFVTLTGPVPQGLRPLMWFREAEGTTLIAPRAEVEAAGVAHEFACRRITLNIHSALDAVGFLARISTRLAALGMGVNPVAGFYHDHLFVPEGRCDDAMQALHEMVREARMP